MFYLLFIEVFIFFRLFRLGLLHFNSLNIFLVLLFLIFSFSFFLVFSIILLFDYSSCPNFLDNIFFINSCNFLISETTITTYKSLYTSGSYFSSPKIFTFFFNILKLFFL